MSTCHHPDCEKVLSGHQKKYCSKSCATKTNNTGNRRHGRPVNICPVCSNPTKRSSSTYCSNKCQNSVRKKSEKELLSNNAERQSTYRAKGYRILAPDADRNLIKEIYKNCPEGYEVDHITPVSKGGLHHQDNLQYLTIGGNRSKGNRT
ncbi:MAG: hypothetical protein K2W88_14115 [Pararheinheimera sp.]|nr:hypothetical protein [Rheinheimera sp.]